MEIRFYIDPETDEPHIHAHHVDEVEVVEVLHRPLEDRAGRDDSRVAIGQTKAGRYLRVIYVRDRGEDSVFVVTSYELSSKERLALNRRRRKRQ